MPKFVYYGRETGMSGIQPALASNVKLPRYRFGNFELDTNSGELRRNGVKLRLQEQPFVVLRTLLESAGSIVPREDLHAALWPADTFVDFDTSLNTAIKRLREVLGDSADVPVFIETIPRRGYRFLAPVQVTRNGTFSPVQQQVAADHAVLSVPVRHLRWGLIAGGVVLGGVIIAAILVGYLGAVAMPRVTDSTQITFDGIGKGELHVRGGQIYFNEKLANQLALMKVPTTGGTPVVLASSYPGLYLGDVSADNAKLLVGTPGDMWKGPFRVKVMDLSSGALQTLGGMEAHDGSWAPGGKLIFANDKAIFVANADGTDQRRLLTAPGPAYHMRYSPDGRRLRFSVGNKHVERESIWEVRSDGSGLHEILTEMTQFPSRCCGEWSPDGRYFYFQTQRNGTSRIWAVAEQRRFLHRRTAPVELTTVPPNFSMGGISEDGRKLYVKASEPRAELVRYDSVSKQFVPFLSGISAGGVEATRDGRFFVYIRYPEAALWRAKEDGSEAAQLTGPSLRTALPHWSPDGKHIAFSGARPGRPWNIFLIAAAGGPAEQLTDGPVYDLDATWSPDGGTLAFGQTRVQDNAQTVSIQLLDLASRRITPLPDSEGLCCPRWSPDGRYLVAARHWGEVVEVYEFATQKWRVIPKGPSPTGYIEWSSDGKEIMFDSLDRPDPTFYRLRISDLRLQTVAPIGEIRRYYTDFGPWSGAAPDGSPLLVRDISNEEVYALELQFR